MSNETTVRWMAQTWAGNGMRNAIHTGLAVALAAGLSAAALAQAPIASHTSLTAETREVGGHTVATFTSTVLTAEGNPATGVVTLVEKGKSIAGAAIDSTGNATITLDSLTPGDHSLTAVYGGSATSAASTSELVVLHPQATVSPDFSVAITPASLTVKQGAAGSTIVSVAPVAGSGFTGFISLSCSGTGQTTTLPVGVTCSFSPANLQITSTSAVTANLSVQTSTAGGTHAANQVPSSLTGSKAPVALAVLLPGAIGLCFLTRKRKNLRTVALLILIGGVSLLGTTACSARYRYLNHGPGFGGTALGSYTITITAQTSNGVTATAHSTPLALTVD